MPASAPLFPFKAFRTPFEDLSSSKQAAVAPKAVDLRGLEALLVQIAFEVPQRPAEAAQGRVRIGGTEQLRLLHLLNK